MSFLKNPFFLAGLSGILFSLSWPTCGFPFLLFIAFVPLLYLEKQIRVNNSKRSGLKLLGFSYIAFFIWNVYTTSWLYYASPFGMAFAVLANSLLMSLVFVFFHAVAKRTTYNRALVFFVALWISFEKMHLEWDFSWPWLNLGNVFSDYIYIIQWYEYTGTFGGTLWILILNMLFFKQAERYTNHDQNFKKKWFLIVIITVIPIGFSAYLYFSTTVKTETQKEVIVIQPNIDPYTEKYSQTNGQITHQILEQTDSLITENTRFVITPETVLAEHSDLNKYKYSSSKYLLDRYLEQHPSVSFLLGYDTYRLFYNEADISEASNKVRDGLWVNYYNAAIQIDTVKREIPTHYKSKLVVGVENLPYKKFLKPLLEGFMIDLGGTVSSRSMQDRPSVFYTANSTVVAPVICYESVYGEYVNQYIQDGAQFIAIMTNDAWWNETQGHKQHLSLARLRAIETRRDIARSANTGISGFINSRGEITQRSVYNEKTALIGTVSLNDKLTIYTRYGDYIARIAFFVALGIGLVSLTKRRFSI